MSDDIERLLAEVSKSTASQAPQGQAGSGKATPARKTSGDVERSSDKPGGRIAFAVISAVVFGAVAFAVGLFTPFVLSGTSMGLGAALGSFLTAVIAGPPRWFSS